MKSSLVYFIPPFSNSILKQLNEVNTAKSATIDVLELLKLQNVRGSCLWILFNVFFFVHFACKLISLTVGSILVN